MADLVFGCPAVAAQLKAVSIARPRSGDSVLLPELPIQVVFAGQFGIAVAESPATIHIDGVSGHVKVPAVVGVLPGPATRKTVVGSGRKLAGKAVGVFVTGPPVEVAVGIAIFDQVVGHPVGSIGVVLGQADLYT